MKRQNKAWSDQVYSLFGLLIVAYTGAILAITPARTYATNPQIINFQGKVVNANGTNVTDGSYTFSFKLYSVSTAGSALWTESKSVTVTSGVFQTSLGDTCPLNVANACNSSTPLDFNANPNLYLGITFNNDVAGEMSPRIQMSSVPYALNSDKVGGLAASQLARNDAGNTFSAAQVIALTSATALQIQNGSANNVLSVDTSADHLTLGKPSTINTDLVFSNISNANQVSLKVADGTAAYSLTLPSAVAGSNQCLVSGTVVGSSVPLAYSACDLQAAYNLSSSPATITETAAKGISIVASAPPTTDILAISNTGQAVATSGVNGLNITYIGGAITASGEASGARIDVTPGSTNPSTWNGLRIVSTTGAATGVAFNGIKIDGPASAGLGTETGLDITTGWDVGIAIGSGGLQLTSQSDPSTPAAGNIRVYARKVVGRTMLKALSPNGTGYFYQPSLFQQNVFMVTPGSVSTTAGPLAFGAPITFVTAGSGGGGTYTNAVAVPTEAQGFMANFSTGVTSGNTMGFMQTVNQYYRGTTSTGSNGFFVASRIALPDTITNYQGATGASIWIGLSSLTAINSMTTTDTPTAEAAGFRLSGRAGETAFQFMTNTAATRTITSTGVTPVQNDTYDLYTYVAGQGTTISWRIDDLTTGVTTECGVGAAPACATLTLPVAGTSMRYSMAIQGLTTTARQLRFQRTYVETDR